MSFTSAKSAVNAIIAVTRVNNSLQFVSAANPIIPYNVILLKNLKSINVYHSNPTKSYTLIFSYLRITDTFGDNSERIFIPYSYGGFEWEKEAHKIINDTMRLI